MPDRAGRFTLEGTISGVGFSSGHRVVVGQWRSSPIGPFTDLMWADPTNHRTLVAESARSAAFITGVYEFDSVEIDESLSITTSDSRQQVSSDRRALEFELGRSIGLPLRPTWITEHIERPIAARLLGVETSGVSPTGVHEVYRARRVRRIVGGWGFLDGIDLGQIVSPRPVCGFGFSEPPPFASLTEVSPVLHDQTGGLAAVINTAI